MSKLCDKLRIGEVSRESGVSVKALRYYEMLGLLSPAGRSEASYRLYSEDARDPGPDPVKGRGDVAQTPDTDQRTSSLEHPARIEKRKGHRGE